MSFYGATDTPVLNFWWHALWVSEWASLFALGRGIHVTHSLRFFWLCSGGSRISQKGAPTKGANVLFCKIFVENCMKMKEFGPSGATPGSVSALLICFFVLRLCVSLSVSLSVGVCVCLLVYLKSDWGGVGGRDDSNFFNFLITARKRSLRRLCFYTCLSVILFTGECAWQRGHAWQGACMPGGCGEGHWLLGLAGVCRACPPDTTRYGRSVRGRYASYWNAFLFQRIFKCKKSWVCPGTLANFPRFYSSLWE